MEEEEPSLPGRTPDDAEEALGLFTGSRSAAGLEEQLKCHVAHIVCVVCHSLKG